MITLKVYTDHQHCYSGKAPLYEIDNVPRLFTGDYVHLKSGDFAVIKSVVYSEEGKTTILNALLDTPMGIEINKN